MTGKKSKCDQRGGGQAEIWRIVEGGGEGQYVFSFFFCPFAPFPSPPVLIRSIFPRSQRQDGGQMHPPFEKEKQEGVRLEIASLIWLYMRFSFFALLRFACKKKLAVIVAKRIMASEVLKQRSKRFCFSHQAHIVSSVKSKPSLKESRMTMVSISVSHLKCSIKGAKCYGDFCPEWGLLMV